MSPEKLNLALRKLESLIEQHSVVNSNVSKVNVGWHLDHSLKVINNVSIALQNSDPKSYTNNFSFLGKLFFALGYFPRGKAKAPKYVRPPEVILKEDLISQMKQANSNVAALHELNEKSYFKHPIFGNISKKRVHKFLTLHTNHHLKIMNDIIVKQSQSLKN